MPAYDAFLLLSFGGPEGPDDVLPFLENVTAGRGVPAERLAEVGVPLVPVGSPVRGSLTMRPAGGSGVSRVIPEYWRAFELTIPAGPP